MCESLECHGEVKQSAVLTVMFDDSKESSSQLPPREHRPELHQEFVCAEKSVYIRVEDSTSEPTADWRL
jgi:hypothetical protein